MNAALQPFSMAGKTVLITTAASRPGAHFARLFSRAGARVVIGAQRVEQLEQLLADIQWEGGEVLAVALDACNGHSVEEAFDKIATRFGGIDVLINHAANSARGLGICAEQLLPTTALDPVARVAHCASRRMVEAGCAGSIINIAWPLTAKVGVIRLSQSMAEELAHLRIRVNAIAPDHCHHESDDDCLADLNGPLLLLASAAGAGITGAVLPVL